MIKTMTVTFALLALVTTASAATTKPSTPPKPVILPTPTLPTTPVKPVILPTPTLPTTPVKPVVLPTPTPKGPVVLVPVLVKPIKAK